MFGYLSGKFNEVYFFIELSNPEETIKVVYGTNLGI